MFHSNVSLMNTPSLNCPTSAFRWRGFRVIAGPGRSNKTKGRCEQSRLFVLCPSPLSSQQSLCRSQTKEQCVFTAVVRDAFCFRVQFERPAESVRLCSSQRIKDACCWMDFVWSVCVCVSLQSFADYVGCIDG